MASPNNPMGIVTNNPSKIRLTPTMKAGNMVGVNNVQPIPNSVNPKSVGQPSANGYSVGSTNPNFRPFTEYKAVQPLSNPPQAIQVEAKPIVSSNAIAKGFSVVGSVFAVKQLGEELGDVFGFFANYPQYVKNALESDRLKDLIKKREEQAKIAAQRNAIDNARIDRGNPTLAPSDEVVWHIKFSVSPPNAPDGFGVFRPAEYDFPYEGLASDSITFSDCNPRPALNGTCFYKNGVKLGEGYIGNPSILSLSSVTAVPKNPVTTQPSLYNPVEEWPYGEITVKVAGSPIGLPKKDDVKPFVQTKEPDNLGKPTSNPPIAKSRSGFAAIPSTSTPTAQPKPAQTPSKSGLISTPATQIPATQIYANGMTNQDYNAGKLPSFPRVQQQESPLYQSGSQVRPNQPTVQSPPIQNTTPTTPTAPASNDALNILGAIAAVAATVTGLKIGSDFLVNKSLEIKNQTSPENLRDAAQKGSCDTLNSPSCTANLKNDIKQPILDKVNENAGALAALNNLLTGSILPAVNRIWDFLNRVWQNQAVDKVMQFITMITVIHNAAMLTRGIADTLGSAIDQGLQVFGLQLKDKDGNQIGVSTIIGQSVQNLIKGIIGADNYAALNETWIQANRVYQTGINLLSNIQSIVDSSTAVAELTSNRLGTWMNAARNAGLVRENAYGAQSENVTRFNAFQNKLEALEQGVSNTAAITGNILSVQQSVNELKTNRQELDNALKNKPQGTGLTENDAEKAARETKKEQSIYTIGDFSVVKPPEPPEPPETP
jgi:hypothetical protein